MVLGKNGSKLKLWKKEKLSLFPNSLMKKKISSIAGVTLIEILIGILISVIMMGAMFTSYTAVNSTYRQVTDRAKISRAGRDIVGMIVRDIRMAGFKYFNDNIQTTNAHAPIIITKSTTVSYTHLTLPTKA